MPWGPHCCLYVLAFTWHMARLSYEDTSMRISPIQYFLINSVGYHILGLCTKNAFVPGCSKSPSLLMICRIFTTFVSKAAFCATGADWVFFGA